MGLIMDVKKLLAIASVSAIGLYLLLRAEKPEAGKAGMMLIELYPADTLDRKICISLDKPPEESRYSLCDEFNDRKNLYMMAPPGKHKVYIQVYTQADTPMDVKLYYKPHGATKYKFIKQYRITGSGKIEDIIVLPETI